MTNIYIPSNFYCTKCGNKNFNVYRKKGQERKGGHLKKLYCIYCKEETNNAEVKENDPNYTYEDFLEEFESGRFIEGNRIDEKDLPLCSLETCQYNINGKCWNANNSAECPYKPKEGE